MYNKKYDFFLILFLSVAVGISIGIVVSLFHLSINWVLINKFHFIEKIWPWQDYEYIAYMFLSSLMIFISVYMVRKYAPDAAGSGIQNIEGVLGNKMNMRSVRIIIVKFFGGILSIGAGMSMGREGPSVQIGGALGELIPKIFNINKDTIRILIAAGAGAGLATTFNAPLAGILFVFEEMREEIKYTYIPAQTVITAVVVSIVTLHIIVGSNILIPVNHLISPNVYDLWIFIIFGLFFGILGFIFNKYLVDFTTKIAQINGWKFHLLILIIGAIIGLLVYIYPDTIGEGYKVIHSALNGSLALKTLLILFALRFLITMISYGTGAPGGIFAPMLALGTLFGVSFGLIANKLIPSLHIEPSVFAVVGMGALFSATVRAPLTGIVLVAELTSSFNLLMPLLITSLVAITTVKSLGGRAIYTILLEQALKISKFGNIDNKNQAKK